MLYFAIGVFAFVYVVMPKVNQFDRISKQRRLRRRQRLLDDED